ncbi:hypothetical protein [Streptomyces sp. CB00455]|uniref:hypothetical protein n=1 Tax=Streptomyces sp. CB00455 TaxID=1703927 RepID=UPI00093CB87C|nr:hypothetical protein [Streptomyces sp. CB00455]
MSLPHALGLGRLVPGALIPSQHQPSTARHRRAPGHRARSDEVADPSAPLYAQLVAEWTARGSAVPGMPDPVWMRLISVEHFQEETESTLRRLHLAADPEPGSASYVPTGTGRRRSWPE